jgi:two-component system, cell cycle sensor histidine kinase and response regulator CckA
MAPDGLRLLIVDDSRADRDIWKRFLANNPLRSFEFAEEETGRAGLARYELFRPDCTILDYRLPDMDGLHFLTALEKLDHSGAVIVTTAFGTESIAVRAMQTGAIDYLAKNSITAETLLQSVLGAVRKHALTQEVERQRIELARRQRELEAALAAERQARGLAEESESRYRGLLDALPQIVWTAGSNGGFLQLNEMWSQFTGQSPEAGLGRRWIDWIHEEDRPRLAGPWQETAQTLVEIPCRLRHRDGVYRWQVMRAFRLPKTNGGAEQWVGTFTDIEEQKRAEKSSYQKQKLASIGVLAGGIAHDFNNLLVGAVGGVSFALDALPPGHPAGPMLKIAAEACDRAADLTKQLLAYAGKGAFVLEPVDLASVVSSTIRLLRASIARSIEIDFHAAEQVPHIFTDASQMQQLVMNLLINAAEAIGEGRPGTITINLSSEAMDPEAASASEIPAGIYILLEVRDTGCGMDEATRSRIFEPFFSTKFLGRGMGLAAVHGIVMNNKGLLQVASMPGEGTQFRVLLPAVTTAAGPKLSAGVGAANAPGSAGKGAIVVVDDEPLVRAVAMAALGKAGYSVQAVESGAAAIEWLSGRNGLDSLVILDVEMPGLSGHETLRRIGEIAPHCPVIISSGYSEDEVARRLHGSKVSGFLKKPYTAGALVHGVGAVFAQRGRTGAGTPR